MTAAPLEEPEIVVPALEPYIQKRIKQGAKVITAPPHRHGGYRAVIDKFIRSNQRRVVVDMEQDNRRGNSIYDGFKRHIKPEDQIKVKMFRYDVFLEKKQPAPARKTVLDRTQLERLPESQRAEANGRFCQLPGCGMPLVAHQQKYCSLKHFGQHRAYMRAHGIDRQTVEPVSSVPDDVGMRGVTVVCGEAVRPSRQSDGGPGSSRTLAASTQSAS
jgi:hypothetical protein